MKCARYILIGIGISMCVASFVFAFVGVGILLTNFLAPILGLSERMSFLIFMAYLTISMGAVGGAAHCYEQNK